MSETPNTGTRQRLLTAAADLIAADPGGDFSLRAVCDAVGVAMPTLYHFFGSKQGLIDAVVDHGFERYEALKRTTEPSGDPITDIRRGWDAHVAFGRANPGFYTLMYGKIRPGYSPRGQARPNQLLLQLVRDADAQGRLVMEPEQATALILAANIGVTLRQIVRAEDDRELTVAARETVIAGITGTAVDRPQEGVRSLVEFAVAHPEILGDVETPLFVRWVARLSASREAAG